MRVLESAENYLETVLMLSQRDSCVRSVDIARELGFSKPSVSIAMKQLRENGFVSVDDSGRISLLPAGREVAERIYERHRVLSDVLISIGVSESVALEDACRIEHVISPESFDCIQKHIAGRNEQE